MQGPSYLPVDEILERWKPSQKTAMVKRRELIIAIERGEVAGITPEGDSIETRLLSRQSPAAGKFPIAPSALGAELFLAAQEKERKRRVEARVVVIEAMLDRIRVDVQSFDRWIASHSDKAPAAEPATNKQRYADAKEAYQLKALELLKQKDWPATELAKHLIKNRKDYALPAHKTGTKKDFSERKVAEWINEAKKATE